MWFEMSKERINHSTISNSQIILYNDLFSLIKVNDNYIFQWADKDLRR